jgi:tetratricopeptide (TPR) repeat protein
MIFAKAQLEKCKIVSMMESGDYAAAGAAAAKFGDQFASPQNRCIAMFYLSQGLCENAAAFLGERDTEKIANYLKQVVEIQEKDVIGKIGRGPMQLEAYLIASDSCQRLSNHSKAIEYYNKILNEYSEYEYCWHIQFMVGLSYEEMLEAGNISELQAKTQIESAYRKVLKNYPDCKAAKLAKKWLVRNGSEKTVD